MPAATDNPKGVDASDFQSPPAPMPVAMTLLSNSRSVGPLSLTRVRRRGLVRSGRVAGQVLFETLLLLAGVALLGGGAVLLR